MSLVKSLELGLKQLLLRVLSWGKSNGTSAPLPSRPVLVFIRLNNVGDALVTLPLIQAAHSQLGAQVHVLCSSKNAIAFRGDPAIASVHVLPKGLKAMREAARWARSLHPDAVVDLHDNPSATATYLTAWIGAPRRIALARDPKVDRVYTALVPRPSPFQHHVVERVLALAPLLGLDLPAQSTRLHFPIPVAANAVAAAFVRQAVAQGGPALFIGCNISAGNPARWWGVEPWREVLRFLRDHPPVQGLPVRPVLLASPVDEAHARAILAAGDLAGVVPLYLERDYRTFAAICWHLDGLVSPDTAAVHLAAAAQLPTFGLYVHIRDTQVVWHPWNSPYVAFLTPHSTLPELPVAEVLPQLAEFVQQLTPRSIGQS